MDAGEEIYVPQGWLHMGKEKVLKKIRFWRYLLSLLTRQRTTSSATIKRYPECKNLTCAELSFLSFVFHMLLNRSCL